MEERLLDGIKWPADLKRLEREKLPQVAEEMRAFILDSVNRTGGHLGSGMGAVELTLALHYIFDFREDRLVFDVGHQCYPHKILTGRKKDFPTLRQKGGLSGFTNRFESPYDVYTMGHAGTAVSTALGIAYGDAMRGRSRHSVAVVGDAAFGAGVAFEAMNHGGAMNTRLLVILNDNNWSIAKTVGALSTYLNRIRTGSLYVQARRTVHQLLQAMPVIGEKLDAGLEQGLKVLHNTLLPGQIFEALGAHYFGPIDGHDIGELIDTLDHVKDLDGVTLLHVKTQKGKGVEGAENRPDRAHAAKPAAPKKVLVENETAAENESIVVIPTPAKEEPRVAWTKCFSNSLVKAGERDERVFALTAAMPDGTGVDGFMRLFPKRTVDAGIAEQHTVAFASGLATAGLRPVAAIYSTFLQRGYDMVFQEVALQKLPVIFAMDRAGVVGEDGPTHHGIFDIAYLGALPGVVMMSPRDGVELGMMLDFGLTLDGPSAIRYPRGSTKLGEAESERSAIELGRSETLRAGEDLAIVAYGSEVEAALGAADRLAKLGVGAEVVNARFAKPMDSEMLKDIRSRHELVLTVEDHALRGGFGACLLEALHQLPPGAIPRVRCLGIPDTFQEHAGRDELLHTLGLDAEGIAAAALEELELQHRGAGRFQKRRVEEAGA